MELSEDTKLVFTVLLSMFVCYLFRFYVSFQVFSCIVCLVAVCFNPAAVSPSGIFCGHLVTDSGCL